MSGPNWAEVYGEKAKPREIHEMSGRASKQLTEFINKQILNAINPQPHDILLDVGCGDGTLLKTASALVAESVGIVPKVEECETLRHEYENVRNVSFRVGLAQQLPCEDGMATKVVCNGVFLYLDSKAEVAKALSEIVRVSKPNALIWIGEIAEFNEFARFKLWRLIQLLRDRNYSIFLKAVPMSLRQGLSKDQTGTRGKKHLFFKPADFVSLLEGTGSLRLIRYFKHKEIDLLGNIVHSSSRNDFLLTKNPV